jgi:hypothetical protein
VVLLNEFLYGSGFRQYSVGLVIFFHQVLEQEVVDHLLVEHKSKIVSFLQESMLMVMVFLIAMLIRTKMEYLMATKWYVMGRSYLRPILSVCDIEAPPLFKLLLKKTVVPSLMIRSTR